MENIVRDIWPFVEDIGIPILAAIAGLSFLSLNFYWSTCHNLRKLEEHLKRKKTLEGYIEKTFPIVGLFDIIYGFKAISKFDNEFLQYELYKELLASLVDFRKYYKIAFPIFISLAIVGITINECIIDK